MTSVAAAATGLAVTTGVVNAPDDVRPGVLTAGNLSSSAHGALAAGAGGEQALSESALTERRVPVSRSDNRDRRDGDKAEHLNASAAPARSFEEDLSDADPRTIAKALLPEYGFSADQFDCLDALYVSESDWDIHADNPTSSAYGIPQALTSTHDVPAGYYDSAEVQIRWGLDYIRDSYGSPCNAWSFKQGHQWY